MILEDEKVEKNTQEKVTNSWTCDLDCFIINNVGVYRVVGSDEIVSGLSAVGRQSCIVDRCVDCGTVDRRF